MTPVAGLGWVDVGVEPGIVSNRHWGRLYSVVGAQANHLAFGIDAGTAVEFGPDLTAPRVVGDSAAVVLDGQYATFGTGSNGALAAHWVILDTFVDGEHRAADLAPSLGSRDVGGRMLVPATGIARDDERHLGQSALAHVVEV